MRAYLKLFKNSFQSNFAYKSDAFFRAVQEIIAMVVQISVWSALYAFTDQDPHGVNLQTMIYYVIISAGISALANSQADYLVSEKIRTGAIAMDFIKPMSFLRYMFSVSFGTSVFDFVFRFIPLLIVFVPLYGMYVPGWETILVFALSLIGGIIINFLLAYIVGLIGFWYLDVWHVGRLRQDLTRLFAGAFLPLWLFPEVLYNISLFLPFRFIYYVPITIYLEQIPLQEALWSLLLQVFWIGVLYGVSALVWSRGKAKLVVQGG